MLKVCVFGTGHLGKCHVNNWKAIPDAEIVGFYDPDAQTSAEVSEKYQIKSFNSVTELMYQCDPVDIIAPTNVHFDLCQQAIRKVKHLFVEQPLANNMEASRELITLLQQ